MHTAARGRHGLIVSALICPALAPNLQLYWLEKR